MQTNSNNEDIRNINWEEVESKIKIIVNKFSTSVESRYLDDLAQELRIHAYYKSDDYYNLQRRAIDFWRSLRVNVMPEVPYFDLEVLNNAKMEDFSSPEYESLVELISTRLETPVKGKYDNEIRELAIQIFNIIRSDIEHREIVKTRTSEDYAPYHNQRISCSYLWDVLGDHPGDVKYARIRKALKLLENILIDLNASGLWEIDTVYIEGGED